MPDTTNPAVLAAAERARNAQDPWKLAARASDRLRAARERLGLSLNQLAVATGIPAATIWSYERNERWALSSPLRLTKLCAALGLDPADLLAEAERLT